MEPIPEVRGQLDRLSALVGDGTDVGAYLMAVAKVAQAVVPSCVGVSITIVIDGEPYTVTATTPETAQLDAVQNMTGGPCVDAVATAREIEVADVLDEQAWQFFAQAATTSGIRSTLSFPIRDVDDMVAGGVNMYASEPDAFAGDRRMIEVALSADLSEVVSNADLSFRTLEAARRLPERLDAKEKVDDAVGALGELLGWHPDLARARLGKAATLAGVPAERVADVLMAVMTDG
ncbi:MAG: hypothetical protein QOI54_2552 [Actinomycetota bacterium]|jgi:hypothetical protein|nr:hypothetical protein [Actinomycetota bacterium]